jgi:FKBP-type peptidyl-prolyl cis-trans isomerase FkpA
MSELQCETLREGNGAVATAGQTVTVHYVGTLTDGKKFDSSRDRGQGFTFRLGAGQVIQGWDKGVAGMKIGELRKLTIPSHMAYGAGGFPPVIPPNATLVFEVELLGLK